MPATITDTLRQQIARDFFERFEQQTHNYYVGIGRSEPWDSNETVPTPINSPEDVARLRDGLQSIKKVAANLWLFLETIGQMVGSIHHMMMR